MAARPKVLTRTGRSGTLIPSGSVSEEFPVKPDIHPSYVETAVTCSCGNTFTTRSTSANGVIHAEVCSACHPFYTGKQKILDVGGRVEKFEKRYANKK
jgi:large subunit ribosomal protein L31